MRVFGIVQILGLVAAIAIAGCAGQALPTGNYGTVHGIVKSTSGAAIAGATITIDTVLTATTDSNGAYTITTVPADDANTTTAVYCTAPSGYVSPSAPLSIKVVAGQTTEADFTLRPQT